MMRRLSRILSRFATGWLVLAIGALWLLFAAAIMPWSSTRLKTLSGGTCPLDVKFFYSADRAYQMLAAYGEKGRSFYLTVELTLDIVYPIIYTLFLVLLITWLYRRAFPPGNPLQRWNILPFGVWLFDLFENLSIVMMLVLFPERFDGIAWAATSFTTIKWTLALACLVLVLMGLRGIWRWGPPTPRFLD